MFTLSNFIYSYLIFGVILGWALFYAAQLKASPIRGFILLFISLCAIIYLESISFIPDNFDPFRDDTPLWFMKLLTFFPKTIALILLISMFFLLICTPTIGLHCILYLGVFLFKKVQDITLKNKADNHLLNPNFLEASESIGYPKLFKAYQVLVYPLIYALYPALILGNTLIICFFIFMPDRLPLGISISGIIALLSYAYCYQQFVKSALYSSNTDFSLPYTTKSTIEKNTPKTVNKTKKRQDSLGNNSDHKIQITKKTKPITLQKRFSNPPETHQPLPEIDQENLDALTTLDRLIMRIPREKTFGFLRFSLFTFIIIRFFNISHNPFISLLAALCGLTLAINGYIIYKKFYDEIWLKLLRMILSPINLSRLMKELRTKGTTSQKELYITIYYSAYFTFAYTLCTGAVLLAFQLFNSASPLFATALEIVFTTIIQVPIFFLPALPICYCLRHYLMTLFDASPQIMNSNRSIEYYEKQLISSDQTTHTNAQKEAISSHTLFQPTTTLKNSILENRQTINQHNDPKDSQTPIATHQLNINAPIARSPRRDTARRSQSVRRVTTQNHHRHTTATQAIYSPSDYPLSTDNANATQLKKQYPNMHNQNLKDDNHRSHRDNFDTHDYENSRDNDHSTDGANEDNED